MQSSFIVGIAVVLAISAAGSAQTLGDIARHLAQGEMRYVNNSPDTLREIRDEIRARVGRLVSDQQWQTSTPR